MTSELQNYSSPSDEWKIAVIGLGYVGLPLAVEFAKKRIVHGFDVDINRIRDLANGVDRTGEVAEEDLIGLTNLNLTAKLTEIESCNCFIVTVPTPIDEYKRPDLSPLITATEAVGEILKVGDVVIYESTVYPGATEEDCVPILEKVSGLIFNKDFFVGYSPERINPGDKTRRLATIKKVVSGSTVQIASEIDKLYQTIITAGTFLASSIKVAEAAKVIENTQRDLNIALVNELAIIFGIMGIETHEVLRAAGTKWNFLPFQPGLVGGHCIGVDPYYLTHKAQALGYQAEVILAGRRVNDGMGKFVASQMIKEIISKKIEIVGAKILIMGLTFKENCPDLRNTRVIDVVRELTEYGIWVDIFDPVASRSEASSHYGVDLIDYPQSSCYDGVIIAVSHTEFVTMGASKVREFCKNGRGLIYDLKGIFKSIDVDKVL